MRKKEKIYNFIKIFKETERWRKIVLIIWIGIGICLLCLYVIYFIKVQYPMLKNTEEWIYISAGILILYEIQVLYKFVKRMSVKQKELNRIINKDLLFKDFKEALENYDFVTIPEVICGALAEKESTIILLFVYYFFMMVQDADAWKMFHIYFYLFGPCLVLEITLKLSYLLITKTCVIFMDIKMCRNRKIKSFLKKR